MITGMTAKEVFQRRATVTEKTHKLFGKTGIIVDWTYNFKHHLREPEYILYFGKKLERINGKYLTFAK
jgi:hypothetical protein